MKLKRVLTSITAAAMIVSFALSASAITPLPADTAEPVPNYILRNGVVQEISVVYDLESNEVIEGSKLVRVTGENQGTFVFMIDEDTFFFEGGFSDIKVGANITGLYDTSLPMMMIYPPQYRIAFAAVGYETAAPWITVARFDENFLSEDGKVALNIRDDAEITFQDGTEFDGDISELANRRLLVFHTMVASPPPSSDGPMTMSSPDRIIVLFERAVPPIHQLSPGEIRGFMMVMDNAVIKVNGEAITNRAFISDSNHLMVPVREVAEAMGLVVTWFADTRRVSVGIQLSFTLDSDYYAFARMAPVSLGQAPILRNNLTYVPIEFFTSQELGALAAGYASMFDEDLDAQVINIIFGEQDE